MQDNWPRALQETFKLEGGYVNHPADPGQATNMGITQATLSKWRKKPVTVKDVQGLKRDEAATIYKQWYWDAVSGDLLPSGLDYSVYDYGVASGPQKAVIELQRLVGAADDGKVGNLTLAAIGNTGDIVGLIEKYNDTRLSFYQRLSTWPVFGKGWTNRINAVKEISNGMAQSSIGIPDNHTPKTEAQLPSKDVTLPFILRFIIQLLKAFF